MDRDATSVAARGTFPHHFSGARSRLSSRRTSRVDTLSDGFLAGRQSLPCFPCLSAFGLLSGGWIRPASAEDLPFSRLQRCDLFCKNRDGGWKGRATDLAMSVGDYGRIHPELTEPKDMRFMRRAEQRENNFGSLLLLRVWREKLHPPSDPAHLQDN